MTDEKIKRRTIWLYRYGSNLIYIGSNGKPMALRTERLHEFLLALMNEDDVQEYWFILKGLTWDQMNCLVNFLKKWKSEHRNINIRLCSKA